MDHNLQVRVLPARLGKSRRLVQGTLLAGFTIGGSASALAAATCESLLTASLPNVSIDGAQSIPAGTYQPPGSAVAFTNLPAFCRVTATVSPVPDSAIKIELWLPVTGWNGRYQQVGNHGWGTGVWWSEMAPQLQRGYATGATDDGHPSAPTTPFNVSWAFGHPAKVQDFAYRAVHELARNAKLLVAAFYGAPQVKAYFNGCSDGGREGLREAHDYPADFQGILIGGVASYWTHAATQQLFATTNLVNSGIVGSAGEAVLAAALAAETAACDANDGVTDGIIDNPNQCRIDPYKYVCKAGQDPHTCLTTAQAGALLANVYPVRDPKTGRWVFSDFTHGSEFDQLRFQYYTGLAPFGVATYQIALNDPGYDGTTFDIHSQLPAVDKALGYFNTTDANLAAFAAAGGKLIQYHGWGDAAFTPGWEIRYYRKAAQQNGGLRNVQDFYRLFMEPGVGHCGGGPGPDNIGAENSVAVSHDAQHDALVALTDWSENGTAPQSLIATKFNNSLAADGIELQRPICAYPAEAVYNGSGDTRYADSFHCQAPPAGLTSLSSNDGSGSDGSGSD